MLPRFYSTFPSLMCLYAGGSWGVFGLKHLCFATASTTRATRLITQSLCHSNTCRYLFLRAVPCDLRSAAARQRSHAHVHLQMILPSCQGKQGSFASWKTRNGNLADLKFSSAVICVTCDIIHISGGAACLPNRPIRNAWNTLHHQTWARL